MLQHYKIADLTVAMDTFGRTEAQAQPYLCPQAQPDLTIRTDWRALQKTQPHLNDEDCEYMCTGSSFYQNLLSFDGLLLHASAVVMDGKAYLFSAPCGTGKSTHTGIWQQVFGPERAVILNDDKPALRLIDGVWYAFGTPWSGKFDISRNLRAPLAGICFLHRAQCNTIEPFTGPKVVFSLMEQTARPADPILRVRLMTLLDQLISQIPIWQMGCNMDPEAALVSFQAMSGAKKE